MSDAFIIEAANSYRGYAHKVEAGLVRRERGGFRFFAASNLFTAIENRLFRRPAEAERAAAALLAQAMAVTQGRGAASQRDDDAGSLVDPLALPPDWHVAPGVLGLSFLPFDR
ncbi:hypothetical protein [Ferrovibrio sp.]|uniref:hypothetical protein n=1 Tax=Ferrovibrio sp. TaxID=1917215 RepID=UPI003D14742B